MQLTPLVVLHPVETPCKTEPFVCLLVRKQTWCLASTETIRLIRDGEKGVGGGRGGMEVGGEGDYITYRYTVTTGMTHALR